MFGYFKLKNSLSDNDIINIQIREILSKPEEPFIVADAQDLHNYDKLKKEVLKEPNKFENKPVKQIENNTKCDNDNDFSVMVVNNVLPEPPSLLKSDKKTMCPDDFGWNPSYPIMSCSNSSINNPCKIVPSPQQVLPHQIECGCPNVLTGENYYKSHLYGKCVKVGNYYVKGANYPDYSDYVSPEKSNIRLLSQNTKGLPPDQMKVRNIPQGSNYAFNQWNQWNHWTQGISGPVVSLP